MDDALQNQSDFTFVLFVADLNLESKSLRHSKCD
jgi:hypothetical protein